MYIFTSYAITKLFQEKLTFWAASVKKTNFSGKISLFMSLIFFFFAQTMKNVGIS
jgi:hypothetical protein